MAVKKSGFNVVGQVRRQYLTFQPLLQLRIMHRTEHLNALIEVARHPVSAGDIHFIVAAIFKIKNAGMLQQPAHHAADNDVIADCPARQDAANTCRAP